MPGAVVRGWFQDLGGAGTPGGEGPHGYAILAPLRSLVHTAIDTDGNRRALQRGEEPVPAEGLESRSVLRGWRVHLS